MRNPRGAARGRQHILADTARHIGSHAIAVIFSSTTSDAVSVGRPVTESIESAEQCAVRSADNPSDAEPKSSPDAGAIAAAITLAVSVAHALSNAVADDTPEPVAVTVAHSRAVRRSYATTDPVTDDRSMHVGANVRGRLVRQHGRYLLRFAGGV